MSRVVRNGRDNQPPTNLLHRRSSNPPNKGGLMRRFFALLAFLVSLPAFAHSHHGGMNINISTDDDEPLTRCDQIRATIDGERVPVVEETLDTHGLRSLTVNAARNGGV